MLFTTPEPPEEEDDPSTPSLRRPKEVKKTHYDDVIRMPLYRYFRRNMRPWDRRLPVLIEQEVDEKEHWTIAPPSFSRIALTLLAIAVVYQLMWVIPVTVNLVHIEETWRNVQTPGIVYDNPSVYIAIWVVVHLSSAFGLWMTWLAGGFEKHFLELIPLGVAFVLECLWFDLVFYTQRLDWTLLDWALILVADITLIGLLIANQLAIAAVFFLPHCVVCIPLIVYIAAYINMYGRCYQPSI